MCDRLAAAPGLFRRSAAAAATEMWTSPQQFRRTLVELLNRDGPEFPGFTELGASCVAGARAPETSHPVRPVLDHLSAFSVARRVT